MNPSEWEEHYNLVPAFLQFRDDKNTHLQTNSESYQSVCRHIIGEESEKNQAYINSCINLLKYLKHLKDNEFYEQNVIYCKFLNYLLNKNFHRGLNNKHSISKLYNDLKKEDTGKQFHIDTCEKEIKYIGKYVLGNIDILYNLYDSFEKYKSNNINGNLHQCYYANKCISIYNNSIKTCYVKYDEPFCRKLKEFKDVYNEVLKPGKKCYDAKKVLSYPENNYERNSRETSAGFGSYMSKIFFHKLNSRWKNIAAVILMLLGTYTTLFVLYEFTPLGCWLRPRVQKNLRIGGNKDEGYEKLLSINSQNEQETIYNNEYYIKYNALNVL
ncbi:PIR Superfamily Protein [Plasmodium ovale curtisi]|uniref:PIR Superfamily Protein n=1 Tax=Plasmodium ovale curtisi TaxID=864141 RepID=A0A1A8X822_PLAOA|nr:PIR Superfamily Protein [Plasmodium ovale curtisi]